MKILIIGGTRFVGRRAAMALCEAGQQVSVFTRGRHPIDLPRAVEHIKGDRENEADLGSAAARGWDRVWDNMSYTAAHARTAVELFHDHCDLFIHTSTLAVYSVCEGISSPYREEDFWVGRPLEEKRGTYPYDYGIDRRAGEIVLQEAHAAKGFPFVSVRLPAVLGPRDYSLRSWSYWRRLVEDDFIILPDAGREVHRSVYSEDVVQALVSIVGRGSELAGRAYNLAGREIISLRSFVERSAILLDRPDVEILDIPSSFLRNAGLEPEKLSPYTTWANHLHSIARAQHELPFTPTPIETWLPATIDWHLEHRHHHDPPGWELRQREAEVAKRWRRLTQAAG